MKYIFSIWGNLTFFIANKIIEVDGLSSSDSIFLCFRNYEIPDPYREKYVNQTLITYRNEGENQFKNRIFAGVNIFATRKNIQKFDKLIRELTNGEDFIYYTANMGNDSGNLIVSNPKCKGYYMMEDGLGSYQKEIQAVFPGWKVIPYKMLCWLYPRFFKLKHHFIATDSPKFKGCIATLQSCFPNHQHCLRVIGLPFVKVELVEKIDAILSVDPLFLKCDISVVKKIYADIALYCKTKGYNTIAYKFHPTFEAESRKEIKKEYNEVLSTTFDCQLIELDKSIVLENILMTYPCDFYSDCSSVGIYAHEMGVKCYSTLSIVRKYIPDYGNIISELVKSFYTDVQGQY